MNWFKLYAEFAADPKVQSMSEPMQRRLVMLYCLKCAGDLGKLDDEEIALALRISTSELAKTHKLFVKKGFVGEGWDLPKWDKRQGPMDPNAAERMRRLRANKAEPSNNVARNSRVTFAQQPRMFDERSSRAGAGAGAPEETDTDTEEEGGIPPPPLIPIPDDPVSKECIQVAIERWGVCNGDSIVGDFLRRHKPAYVRYAIDREWDKHGPGIQPAYLRSILQGIEDAGGLPKKPGEDRGKTAAQQDPESTRGKIPRPDLPRTPQFEGVNRYWDDIEAGRTPNPKDLAV